MQKMIVALIALSLVGCATIQYDASTGSFVYQRFGNQELIDLDVVKNLSETKVHLGQQKSEREIAEVIMSLSNNIDKALQILRDLQKKLGVF